MHYDGKPTLTDSKTCGNWTELKSSESCVGCHATPKELCKRHHKKFDNPIPKVLEHGVRQLHSGRLNFFKWACKTYHHKDCESYACSGDKNKADKKIREQELRDNFFLHYNGLKVNMSIAGHRGNVTTGNVVRRAMEKPALFALCTGVPVDLVEDFVTIVTALSCDHDVDPDLLEAFCNDWLNRFHASKIRWNQLTPRDYIVLLLVLAIGNLAKHYPVSTLTRGNGVNVWLDFASARIIIKTI